MNGIRVVLFSFLIGLALIWACTGCMRNEADSRATLTNGLSTVPYVKELRQVFPHAHIIHFFSECGNSFDRRKVRQWNTVVFVGGRYELNYTVEVHPDFNAHRISEIVGTPRFDLVEVGNISGPPDRLEIKFTSDHHFNGEDFSKVVAAGGDFAAIGIALVTNKPVERFNEFIPCVWRDGYIQDGD